MSAHSLIPGGGESNYYAGRGAVRTVLTKNGTKPFILLVEDNPDDIVFTRRALSKVGKGIGLVVAADGVEGLEAYRLISELSAQKTFFKPLFILLDLNLPKVDGLAVYRCFRENEATKDIPIILHSSSREDLARLERDGLGADDYLFKPLSPDTLLSYIKKYSPSGPTP